MEKIELNKRTLRTLTLSELELVGGASEDGDEDPDGSKQKPKPDTLPTNCPCPTELCPVPSDRCPPGTSRNVRCCPNTGD